LFKHFSTDHLAVRLENLPGHTPVQKGNSLIQFENSGETQRGQLRTCQFLGQIMHPLTMSETLDAISARIKRGEFTQHVVLNVAKLVHMRKDLKLRDSVNRCDLINVNGMGVAWGARLCGIEVPERVSGIDLFFHLLVMAAREGYFVFFLGARPEIVEKAVLRIRQRFPSLRIAGWYHGYFWEDECTVVKKIRQSGAKLLFVAISSPQKENFIDKWKNQLGVYFVMGVGGTLDVVAGKITRAPKLMQKAGLEWFYRLCQEPRRMWRRYLITNTVYCGLVVKEYFKRWRQR
jgi:N-acetylglucosaminyldiphosphoundecaprenol N-acetyl-beta-D-mannosaminyltransferase